MKSRSIGLCLWALTAFGCGQSDAPDAVEQTPAPSAGPEEEINLEVWIERMEMGSRELYSAREAVIEAAGVKPGMRIADIGAGTGLYSLLFAEAVGDSGAVFAVDIEPLFLDLINRRAADNGYNNITAVLGRADSVTLPKTSVDIVFIADTYHYFDDREVIMKTIYEALRPGGKLIVVEFDIVPGEARPEGMEHVKFGKAGVISEIEFIGFVHQADLDVKGLNETYFATFTKPTD